MIRSSSGIFKIAHFPRSSFSIFGNCVEKLGSLYALSMAWDLAMSLTSFACIGGDLEHGVDLL